jgi:hypothetical protein
MVVYWMEFDSKKYYEAAVSVRFLVLQTRDPTALMPFTY